MKLSLNPYSILVVDDSDDSRFVLKDYLEDFDCNVYEAENGAKAKTLIRDTHFDLILLDYLMPDTNGHKVLQYLRANLHRETPVIIFSGQKEVENVEKVSSLGISAYLMKPIKMSEFLLKIQELVPIQCHN